MLNMMTESGSLYEINLEEKRIRRVTGNGPGTPRVGPDGEWRTFTDLHPAAPVVGASLLIMWRQNPETGVLETTLTSPVQRVWDSEKS